MTIDTTIGFLTVVAVTFAIGLIGISLANTVVPTPLIGLLVNNAFGHALYLTLVFVLSFMVGLSLVGRQTTNRKVLAGKFALVYFALYGANAVLNPPGSAAYVACLFPVTAYLVTMAFTVQTSKPTPQFLDE